MENEQNKKQGKNGFIIISVTIIVILLLIGFYFFGYQMGKGLANKAKATSTTTVKSDSNNNVEKVLTSLIDKYYRIYYSKENFSELSNRNKQILGMLASQKENGIYADFTSQEVEEGLKSLFKDKQTIINEDIYGSSPWEDDTENSKIESNLIWKYDAESSKYLYQVNHGKGYPYGMPIYTNVTLLNENGKQVTISLKYAFYTAYDDNQIDKIYPSYQDAANNRNSIITISDTNISSNYDLAEKYVKDNINQYINKLSTYTYTFEKVDNNYVLVDYKYTKAN